MITVRHLIPRGIAALAGMLVAALLLTGCGSPPQAGSAAIVGDSAISLDSVQRQLDGVLAREPAARHAQQQDKLGMVTRQILTIRVQHQLITGLAARLGMHADPTEVAAMLERAGGATQAARGTVLDPESVRSRLVDQVLLADLARRELPGLAVTFDYVVAGDANEAKDVARRLAAHPSRAERIVHEEVASGAAGGLGRHARAVRDVRDAASSPLFGLPAHTVAAFPVGGGSGQWLVVLIRDRTRSTSSSTPARAADTINKLDRGLLAAAGLHLLIPYAQRTGIRISPRYGVWDRLGMQVVPSAGERLGVRLPVRGQEKR